MKPRSRIGTVGAALALVAAAAGYATLPAGAAGSFSSAITNASLTLTTGGTPSVLDVSNGSMISGSYDPDAGTLTGDISLGDTSFTATGTPAGDVEVDISFSSGGPIQNGKVDGTNVSFADTETVNLDRVPALSLDLSPCSVGPVTLDYSGTYDPATGKVDVTSNEVTVPDLAGTCGNLASVIAPMINGATVSTSMSFNIGTADQPGPTETTSATTIPATTVPAGTGVDFTGETTTKGCDATVPLHFDGAGDYTVRVVTTNDRVIGTTKVHRDGAGDQNVIVSVDPHHGTKHGDPLNVQVLDANGAVIAHQDGSVDDPNACRPGTKPENTKPLVTPSASPAAAVTAQPSFTG